MLNVDPYEANRVRQLWCAVLQRALDDALGSYGDLNSDQGNPQAHAIAWFQRGGDWFQQVCGMADLDPDTVRASALEMIRRGSASVSYDKRKLKAAERQEAMAMAG